MSLRNQNLEMHNSIPDDIYRKTMSKNVEESTTRIHNNKRDYF